jgi:imidazolonepropionase-like amidohydrolase
MGLPAHMVGPRLVDAHVHIKKPGGITSVAAAGIAAARDAGSKGHSRREGEKNLHSYGFPIILSAEWALYKKGGYGSLLGVAVDTREEIKSEILKLKNAGAGIIKVIASGLVSLAERGRVTPGGFSREELLFIVQEAGGLGLGVMAHANGEAAILAATESGVRSVEHGFFMTGRALEAMAKHGTYWTPTVGALARAAEPATIPNEMKTYITALIASQLEMIGRAREIGVPLAVGTDCLLPDPEYGKIYAAELSYFEQAGISREHVLHIACEGGAKLLGL